MGILITIQISKYVALLWTDGRTKESGDRRTGERTREWEHERISETE